MKSLLPIIMLFLIIVSLISCEKFEADNTDKNYPLTLTVNQDNRNIQLSWTKVNVSTFKEYIIVRSAEPIPDDADLNSFGFNIAARIDDLEKNTFIDQEPLLADVSYYKVFADIGDRFIKTPSKKIELQITTLPFFFNKVAHSAINNKLYYHDSGNDVIWMYDYVQDSIIATVPMNTWNLVMTNGNAGFGEELYVGDNLQNKINIYGGNTFNIHGDIDILNDCYSIALGKDIIVVTQDRFNTPVGIYNRASKNLINSHNFTNYDSERHLGTLSKDNNEFVEVSNNQIDYYDFTDLGNIESHKTVNINFENLTPTVVVSPNGDKFIPYLNGAIYNKDLTEIGKINSSLTFSAYTNFVFSNDGTKIFAVQSSNQKIEVYDANDLTLLDEYKFSFNPSYVFIDNNQLIVTGLGFISQLGTQTIIDIVNLD